jgi:hypothetical protein
MKVNFGIIKPPISPALKKRVAAQLTQLKQTSPRIFELYAHGKNGEISAPEVFELMDLLGIFWMLEENEDDPA